MISPENMSSHDQEQSRAGSETPESRKSFVEMRQHPRLYAPIPLRYQVSMLESDESWEGEGTLRNISLGGIYFTCETPLPLEPGQIRNFSIATAAFREKLHQASSLTARGIVVRVEKPASDDSAFGIAVKFLTPLQLSQA